MDVWGRIYLDHWRGEPYPHAFVRDDGTRNVVESAAAYFEAPRSEAERAVCETLHGRVVDLGCGPGSYTRFLEQRGVDVVAVDSSAGAIRVCRERGCQDARVMDFTNARFPKDELFDALICMGNTVGVHQSPKTLGAFLARLRGLLKPAGRLVVSGVDPLATTVPNRIEYHTENRLRGLPPGLIRTRLEYRGELTDWWIFWLPTEEEFAAAAAGGGWTIASMDRHGASLLWVLRPNG